MFSLVPGKKHPTDVNMNLEGMLLSIHLSSCSEKETSYRREYEAGRDVPFDSFVSFRYELIMHEYYMFKLCMIMICIIRFSRGPKTLPLISTIDMSPDGNSYLT